jgi:hypothetical protein
VNVRIVPSDRRFVPRRLCFDIVDEADVLAQEPDGPDVPIGQRTWRPYLFPGAAYDVPATATGIRGRVTRNGQPVRWTRVEATVGANVIGRAHGDDRGEFLLVLGQNPAALGDLVSPLLVTIDVYRRDPALPTDAADPLADLQVETAAAPGVLPDDVSTGVDFPDHYVRVAHLVDQPIPLGRLTSLPVVIP